MGDTADGENRHQLTLPLGYRRRGIRPDDAARIAAQRRSMFVESGISASVVDASMNGFRAWLNERLLNETYTGWFVETLDAEIVAGLGMFELNWPPHPLHPQSDRRGYILNVYVEKPHRRRGLAKHLMQVAEGDARRRSLRVVTLHATDEGRPLYLQMGWEVTNELRLNL